MKVKKSQKSGSRSWRHKADLKRFLDLAISLGADDAKIIPTRTIKCEEWVRLKCQFGCSGYMKRLTCPPFTPAPEQTARAISFYRIAILIHSHQWEVVNRIVPHLEREIFLSGYYKALGFGSGPCRLCDKCNIDASCKHPYEARPSMEACGINVYQTARSNGFKIEVVKSEDEVGNYFGLIFVD